MNEYLDLGLISSFVPAASSFAGDIDFLFDMITIIVGFIEKCSPANCKMHYF